MLNVMRITHTQTQKYTYKNRINDLGVTCYDFIRFTQEHICTHKCFNKSIQQLV